MHNDFSNQIINAPAGSGKTTLLIKNFFIKPEKTLILTFTNKSQLDIVNKITNILTKKHTNFKDLNIFTIDSFLAKIKKNDNSINLNLESTLNSSEYQVTLDETVGKIFKELYKNNHFRNEFKKLLSLYKNNPLKIKTFIKNLLIKRSYFLDMWQQPEKLEQNLNESFKQYKTNFYQEFVQILHLNSDFIEFINQIITTSDSDLDKINQIEKLLLIKTGFSKKFPIKELTNDWKSFSLNNLEYLDLLYQYFAIHKLLVNADITQDIMLTKDIMQIFKLSYATLLTNFAEIEKQDHLENLISTKNAIKKNSFLLDMPQIEYLLVDEFQDTSIDHYLMIMKIIEINPKMQMFFIGDPMQSIYSFREANLGNFIRIFNKKEPTLESKQIESISLTKNYRSSSKIIDFVNLIFMKQNFSSVFFNQISYSHSIATNEDNNSEIDIFLTNSQEKVILQLLAENNTETAILVRKQSQINQISKILNNAKIKFQAIQTTTYQSNPQLKDLYILTKFLSSPSIKNSLLLLHSSFFKLTIFELQNLPSNINLEDLFLYPELTENQKNIMKKFEVFYQQIKDLLFRINLEQLIKKSLTILASKDISNELLEIFLSQVKLSSHLGQINFLKLHNLLTTQVPFETIDTTTKIHLMTIHQAKGLEFDTVILPFIESGIKSQKEEIIFYRELSDNKSISLFSKQQNSLFDLLNLQKKYRSIAEERRIFYVALTRAKQNLFLIESAGSKNQSNSFSSFLPEKILKKELIFDID